MKKELNSQIIFNKRKWPRHYADKILKMENIEDRRKALGEVPEHLRPMVKHYVEISYAKF